MKLKKMLALLLSLMMVLSFVACGEAAEPTPAEDPAPVEQTPEEADYTQLLTYIQAVETHRESMATVVEMKEGVLDGSVTKEDAIAAYKALAEESAVLYTGFGEAQWQTETYSEQVETLLNALDALSLAEASLYQANVDDDMELAQAADAEVTIFNDQMDALYTSLGV